MDKSYSDKTFGEALKEILEKKGIKLRSLALKTNLNYSYFSKLKRSPKAPPDETILNISQALEIDPEYFMEFRIRKISEMLLDYPALINLTMSYLELSIDDKIKAEKVAEKNKDSF
jgi:transcriptional regulator with XRE-family HTH domain